jgi:hypothetical protein
VRNLAALLAETDERAEPARLQPAVFQGRQVTLQACLERTAVIIDSGDVARLVRLVDLEVDADNLMWEPNSMTQLELAQSARRAHIRQRWDRHGQAVEQVQT